MQHPPYRFCVFGRSSRPLLIFLATLFLLVIALYVAAIIREPDTPIWPLSLILFVAAPLVFLSDRASRDWIEISPHGERLEVIPSWYDRKFSGKRVSTIELKKGCSLLICLHTNYGAFGGEEILLRAADGAEESVYVTLQGFSRVLREELQTVISDRCNVPVKRINRILSADGTQDLDWNLKKQPLDPPIAVGGLLMPLFPLSGVLIRLFTSNLTAITLFGLFFWFLLVVYWRYLVRMLDRDKSVTPVRLGVMLFHYALYYLLAVLITDSMVRK